MSLSFKCDSCNAPISREEIDSGAALQHAGQHYCPRCKAPIVAFLKKTVSSSPGAKGGEPALAAAKAKPVGPKAAAAPGGTPAAPAPKAAGSNPAAAGSKGAGLLQPASKTPPGPPAALKAAPSLDDFLKEEREAQKLSQKKIPEKILPAAPASPLKPLGKAGFKGASKTVSPGHSGPHLRSKNLKFARRPILHKAPTTRRGGDGLALEEASAAGAGRRPAIQPLHLAVGAVAVLMVGGISLVLFWPKNGRFIGAPAASVNSPSTAAPAAPPVASLQPAVQAGQQTAQPPVPSALSAVDPASPQAMEEKLRSWLEKVPFRISDDRDGKIALDLDREWSAYKRWIDQSGVRLSFTTNEELVRLGDEISRHKQRLATKIFNDTLSRSEALQSDLKFLEAHGLWENTPELIEKTMLAQWVREEQKASDYVKKVKLWSKLRTKVELYAKRKNYDIAAAILEENFKDNEQSYREGFPILWKEREKLLQQVRSGEAIASLEKSRIQGEYRRQKEAERLAKLEEERRKRWDEGFKNIKWTPLLSMGGDLENWYKTTEFDFRNRDKDPIPWKNLTEDRRQVLVGDTTDRERPIHIGQNGNRWLDWALEFEVQVTEGSLKLQTKTIVRRWGDDGMVGERAPDDFVFDTKNSSGWTKVHIRAQGSKVRWLEGEEIKQEVEVTQKTGGFCFYLESDSACKIRDPQIKLINVFREEGQEEEGEEGEEEGE
ncbi:MAG: hypothetical protein HY717_05100 [Planctomycetes bacterium]|nr:hypothetical protein [Planctomycetota bacterium]